MEADSIESLVQERVAQLQAITQRRNELLRQMYHMIRRRDRAGSIVDLDDKDDNGLQEFMDQFDLDKNPVSGLVSSLSEEELLVPSFPPPDSEQDAIGQDDIEVDSPMSELPASLRMKSPMELVMEVEEPEVEEPEIEEPEVEAEIVLFASSPARSTPSSTSCKRPREEEEEEEEKGEEKEREEEEEGQMDIPKSLLSRSPSCKSTRNSPLPPPPPPPPLPSPSPQLPITEDSEAEEMAMETDVLPQAEREESPQLLFPSSPVHEHKQPIHLQPMVIHTAVDVATLQPALFIPTPTSPALTAPIFSFEISEHEATEGSPSTPTQPEIWRHHFNPTYTLPPAKFLPSEHSRKSKLSKQRKRDKDKSEGKNKDEWMPLGFVKWGALIRANPVYTKVSRATKCLSTRDWGVAITELRLMRTLERVESLENVAKWSYRQPKKQRNLGGATKTHWDYLLDEMKWLRVDFREERRWKYMLAFNLSTAVLEWHAAGNRGERIKQGICRHWRRPRTTPERGNASQDMDVDGRPPEHRVNDYTLTGDESDNEDEEAEPEQRDIVDSLETGEVLREALEAQVSNGSGDSQSPGYESVRPKVEDVEDPSALRGDINVSGDAMDVDRNNDKQNAKTEAPEAEGLKPNSTDPLLGSLPESHQDATQPSGAMKAAAARLNQFAPLREHIAYSNERKLFIENEDLDLVKAFWDMSTSDELLEPPHSTLDLSDIFPELQPLGVPDVAISSPEGRKKSDKRSEREDSKRVDDSGYTKLAPIGKFMLCKPTLLGPLQPVKRWKNGQWLNSEEPAVTEAETSNKISEEQLSDLFDGIRPQGISGCSSYPPKDSRKRAEYAWNAEEDALLKHLVDKYPNNWSLVADSFNSSRIAISYDKKAPWECFERWNSKFGGNRFGPSHAETSSPAIVDETPPPIPSLSSQVQMTTRGVKRLANLSVAQSQNANLWTGLSSDTLKRRRHTLMYETIRKVAKKREAAQKASMNQRKTSNIHDTHGQYNKLPKLTPAELSRMKAEKESRDHQEMMMARRRHDDLRQHLMRDPRMQAAQGQSPVAGAAQPQQNNGPARLVQQPAQGVPQIRAQAVPQVNISQQQRIPTPMASAAAAAAAPIRMSPQQVLQAQAAAQARALAAVAQSQAHAQMQAQAQAQVQVQVQAQGQAPMPVQNSGLSSLQNSLPVGAHLSPPYQSRAASSSPGLAQQGSPPHNTVPLSNAASPILPPSQPQLPMHGSQVSGNALTRQPGSIGAHYLPVVTMSGHFTQEQMDQAMRMIQQRSGLQGSYSSSS